MTLEKSLVQFKALRDHYEEKMQSLDRLERSVRIKYLWPEAFVGGRCIAIIKVLFARLPRWTNEGQLRWPNDYVLFLKRHDGELRQWSLAGLDMDVWVPFWTFDDPPQLRYHCLRCKLIYKALPGPPGISSGYCTDCEPHARYHFLGKE